MFACTIMTPNAKATGHWTPARHTNEAIEHINTWWEYIKDKDGDISKDLHQHSHLNDATPLTFLGADNNNNAYTLHSVGVSQLCDCNKLSDGQYFGFTDDLHVQGGKQILPDMWDVDISSLFASKPKIRSATAK
jgi:hypothetical protein